MFTSVLVLFMIYLIYFLSTICIRYGYISELSLKNNIDFNSYYIKESIFNTDTLFNRMTNFIALFLFKINNRF